jgi:hypothetical protein
MIATWMKLDRCRWDSLPRARRRTIFGGVDHTTLTEAVVVHGQAWNPSHLLGVDLRNTLVVLLGHLLVPVSTIVRGVYWQQNLQKAVRTVNDMGEIQSGGIGDVIAMVPPERKPAIYPMIVRMTAPSTPTIHLMAPGHPKDLEAKILGPFEK